jgi:hypothetical protein
VPGSEGHPNSPYLRPCPYYVQTDQQGSFVVYSSFNTVEAIDSAGKRKWQWQGTEKPSTQRLSSGGIMLQISISAGPPSVRALAVAPDGSGLLVTTEQGVYWLDGQTGRARSVTCPKETSRAWLGSPASDNVIFLSKDGLHIYKAGRSIGTVGSVEYGASVTNCPERPLYAICNRRDVWLVDGEGKWPVRLEFARNPVGVCFAGSFLVVVAGSLILIDVQKALDRVGPSRRSRSAAEAIVDVAGSPAFAEPIDATVETPVQKRRLTERTIRGRKSPVPAKGKALYINQEGEEVLIEELALGYYREQNYAGLWSENEYWWQLMTLLYWDIVYARLPNVFEPRFGEFPSRLQDIPRDIFSAEFYSRRKGLIAARNDALWRPGVLGLGSTSPEQELRKAWGRHKGKPCRFFEKWQKFTVEDLALAAKVLAHDQLVAIMTRLLGNFGENRRGLPDLFLVKDDAPLFAEVKAQREKVSPAQEAWHKYLVEAAGIEVEICRVVEM